MYRRMEHAETGWIIGVNHVTLHVRDNMKQYFFILYNNNNGLYNNSKSLLY